MAGEKGGGSIARPAPRGLSVLPCCRIIQVVETESILGSLIVLRSFRASVAMLQDGSASPLSGELRRLRISDNPPLSSLIWLDPCSLTPLHDVFPPSDGFIERELGEGHAKAAEVESERRGSVEGRGRDAALWGYNSW